MADNEQPTAAPTQATDPVSDALLKAFGNRATPAEAQPAAAKPAPEQPPAREEVAQPAAEESDDDDESLPVDKRFERAQKREARLRTQAEEAAADREKARRQAASFKGHMTQAQAKAAAIERERDEFRKLAESTDAREDKRWEDAIKLAPDEATRREWEREFALDKRERAAERAAKEEELVSQRKEVDRTQAVSAAEADLRASVLPSLKAIVEGHAESLQLPVSEVQDLLRWVDSPEVRMLAHTLKVAPDPRQDQLTAYLEETAMRLVGEIDQRGAQFEEKRAAQNRREAGKVYRQEQPIGGGGLGKTGPERLEDVSNADWIRALKGSG
jgi:hypothetical protein